MSYKLAVSVVIPSMNRPDTLMRTIDSFLSQEYIPNQIIIVDQSTDESNRSRYRLIKSRYEDITNTVYVWQDIPSLTKARNYGISYCENDIVICSDDDVLVNKDTILNVYSIMQDASIAMIAGIDENSGSSETNLGYLFGTKSYKKRKIGHVTLSMLGRYPDNIVGEIETEWAMGYFFAIRKSLVEKWELRWDENLASYAYAEDLDFSYSYYKKAKLEGLRCVLNDKVKVKHLVSNEYRVPTQKSTYMYVINRKYLAYKHKMSIVSHLALRWTNFGHFLMRLMKRQRPFDLLKAQIYCDLNRRKIRCGKLKLKNL